MAVNAQEAVRNMISYTVVTDKDSLVRLLERNGVQMPSSPSDKEVTASVLLSSSKSPNFKNELSTLLTSKVPQAGSDFASFVGDSSDFGFTGIDDFSFTGADEFFAATAQERATAKVVAKKSRVTETNPQGKTGVGLFLSNLGKAIASPETINSGLNIGLTAVNNKIQGRQNALQQETVVLTEKQDQIRQDLAAAGKPAGGGFPVWGWVVIGLAVVGGIVYAVTKKK
jgi:hypothetical protein